jgi:acyl-CoA hydrolase
MTSYAALLATVTQGRAEMPADWTQGRTLFGGAVAAVGLRAIRHAAGDERRLRSLLVDFAGPVAPGSCHIETAVLREGRSATHAQAIVRQDDSVRAVVVAVLGTDRASTVQLAGPTRPNAAAPAELQVFPYLEGLTPTFTEHFEYRYAVGALPFSGSTGDRIAGWCRFREPQLGASADEVIIALVDAWPSPTLQLMSTPAPASSMTWALDLAPDDANAAADPTAWWYFESRANAAAHGHARIESILWSPDGTAAAFSTQSVVMFS